MQPSKQAVGQRAPRDRPGAARGLLANAGTMIDEELDGLLRDGGLREEISRHDRLLDEVGEPRPAASPRPFFCDARQIPVFERVCDVVHRALERISTLYFGAGRYRREVPIPKHLEGIVNARHGYAAHNVFCRFDIHVGPGGGGLRILELNCADPTSIAWHDWMMRAVEGTRAWSRLSARHTLSCNQLVPLHWDVIRELDRERAGRSLALEDGVTFAIADASTVHWDFVALKRLYERLGVHGRICDPSAFSEDGGRLTAAGRDVSVVIRDTLDEIVLPPSSVGQGHLREAVRTGSAFFVNPTTAVLGDQKALLELLSDPDAVPEIPPEDRAVLAETIPWTRTLRHRTTSHRDAEIDLVSWVLAHRERLVLKPSDGYGGFDVTVGPAVDDGVWRTQVLRALDAVHPFVVQEYVRPAKFTAPPTTTSSGGAPMPFNLSLWSFRGRFVGAIARASDHAVVNVHQGGVLLPVVFYR